MSSPAFPRSLCTSCAHVQLVRSAKGSVFLLCARSKRDPSFPKYPPQPVIRCSGHERAPPPPAPADEAPRD